MGIQNSPTGDAPVDLSGVLVGIVTSAVDFLVNGVMALATFVLRTSIKPPTVIMGMAKVIREEWGIPMINEGEGTGTLEKVVNRKVVDSHKIIVS